MYGSVAMQKCIGLLVWGTYTIFVYDICGLKVSSDTFVHIFFRRFSRELGHTVCDFYLASDIWCFNFSCSIGKKVQHFSLCDVQIFISFP